MFNLNIRSITYLCFLWILSKITAPIKRRTKNAKAFHDKCENPGNWDTRLGFRPLSRTK
ncbi:hypothetical protein ACT6QE_14590 [Staphylococcus aureus]